MTNKYNTVNQEDFNLGVKYILAEVEKLIDEKIELEREVWAKSKFKYDTFSAHQRQTILNEIETTFEELKSKLKLMEKKDV